VVVARRRRRGTRGRPAGAVGQVRDLVGCITEEADLTASFATIAAAVDAVGGTAPHQVGAALRRRPS